MKKKTVAKNVAHECCPAMVSDYKPRLYLSLDGSSVKEVKKLKIGETVELRVTGKVVGLDQRENIRDYGKEKGQKVSTGSIDLESYVVQVLEDEENEFTKLADDE